MPTFNNPSDIAIDQNGNLYVADTGNHAIRKITPEGVVTTFAGSAGERGYLDGRGLQARFDSPSAIAIDPSGNLYVSEKSRSYVIRKITPEGMVTTFAGSAGERGYLDGQGLQARFSQPHGITIDQIGNLYVIDFLDTYTHALRRITPEGMVSTVLRTEQNLKCITSDRSGNLFLAITTDTSGKIMKFNQQLEFTEHSSFNPFEIIPNDLAIDQFDNIYMTETFYNIINRYSSSGEITRFGTSEEPGAIDGSSSVARFNKPLGIEINQTGNIYVADSGNHTIRRITPQGDVTTFAGIAGYSGSDDTPIPLQAQYFNPLAESEVAARYALLHEFQHSFIPERNEMMESMMRGRIDIEQHEHAARIAREAKNALKRRLTQRVLIIKLHNNPEVDETSRQATEWYKAKAQEWAGQKIQIISVANPTIVSLLAPLNEKDKGGNFVKPNVSIEIAKQISSIMMSAPNIFSLPQPGDQDDYRILLVGHRYDALVGGTRELSFSPQALATVILAAVHIMSGDFPIVSPIRVSLVMCLSGSTQFSSSASASSAAAVGGIARSMAPPTSIIGRIQKVLSKGPKSFKPLLFRLKGYTTLVSVSSMVHQSKFRRLGIEKIGPWDSAKRTELVRGRVFSQASFGGDFAHSASVIDALSDSEDDEN